MGNSILRSGSWAVSGKLFLFLSNLTINIIIVRMLVAKDVGNYYAFISGITIFSTFLNFGIKEVFTHKLSTSFSMQSSETGHIIMQYLNISSLISLFIILIFIPLLGLYYLFYGEGNIYLYIVLIIYIALNNVQTYLSEAFRGIHNIKWSLGLGGVFSNGIVLPILLFAWFNSIKSDVKLIFVAFSLASIISLLLGWRKIVTEFSLYSEVDTFLEWKKILTSAFPFFMSILGLMLIQESYVWVTKINFGSEALALIGVAFRFVGLIAFPITILSFFISPIISKHIAKKKMNKLEIIIRTLSLWFAIPSVLVFVFFVFFGDLMLLELFGPTYEDSYFCLLILCFGQLINILTGCNGTYLIVTGQGKLLMKATIIGGFLSITLMAILGALWALEGVAIGYAVGVAYVGIYCAHKIYFLDGIKTWVGGTFNLSKLYRIVAL